MEVFLPQFLTGLASASSLFLVACGLTIIFGVTRIVNFAHGSFFMLGAYFAYSLSAFLMAKIGPSGYWLALALATIASGLLGLLMEVLLLRRLYRAPELVQLLATFGVVLVVQDIALAVWGPEDLLGPRAPGFSGSVVVFGTRMPEYDLLLIAIGPLVLLLLWFLFYGTRWGLLVRAATEDRDMAAALGVRESRLFTTIVVLGTALAGFGGALQLPREAANLGMDLNIIVEAFVVVVVGGMGSIIGAFVAALLIAELSAFGILVFPKITLVLLFLVMAVVLVLRPNGLFGKKTEIAERSLDEPPPPLTLASLQLRAFFAAITLALASLPIFAGDFALGLASEILIFALFAASLQFLMGVGGMISFGHAAYFGLGAYGAALAVKHLDFAMEAALLVAPVAALLGAIIYGWFCVRLSGVYLAMLTLAFAQITWSVAFQWIEFTGGDNGILAVWPSAWASSAAAFYWLTLALVICALAGLRVLVFSPFGYGLRAARDAPVRAASLGLNLHRQRWTGFVLAGLFAGLAGGLYAFLKGSVFPDTLAIPTSVDALVMVLLGGVETLFGPYLGAALLTGLKAELVSHTNLWRLAIGSIIIFLVLVFPKGLLGSLRVAWANRT